MKRRLPMTPASKIDEFERTYRGVYSRFVIVFLVFSAAWLVRFIVRTIGTLPEWLDIGFAVILILTLPAQFYSVVRLSALRKRGQADAELGVLFTDERIQAHGKAAWMYGFIAMASVLAVLGAISVFADLKDTNAVIFTALWAGFGAYHLSFVLMERR
jgi:hypothetical protein